MGRVPTIWHVWHWDGSKFDLVWHDLNITEAREVVAWRNERAEAQGSPNRYVATLDGMDPVLPDA